MTTLPCDPIKDAEYFAMVENSNFLAHSIRMIEHEFIKQGGVPYRIFTRISSNIKRAVTLFFKEHCIINLPSDTNERKVRFALGHELGHIVFRFDDLKHAKDTAKLEATEQEETFAWMFAYSLIKAKSDQHRDDTQRGKFVYKENELEAEFLTMVRESCPNALADVTKNLFGNEQDAPY